MRPKLTAEDHLRHYQTYNKESKNYLSSTVLFLRVNFVDYNVSDRSSFRMQGRMRSHSFQSALPSLTTDHQKKLPWCSALYR